MELINWNKLIDWCVTGAGDAKGTECPQCDRSSEGDQVRMSRAEGQETTAGLGTCW